MSKSRAEEARGIKTLAGLVGDFRRRLGPEGPLEHGYLDWMREAPNIRVAIDRAVRSRMPNGKMHNHQSRVPLAVLLRYGKALPRDRFVMKRDASFHWLLRQCERTAERIDGIGPVTAYDVAQRLGAYLNLEPDRVYLHAGVKDGAEALGLDTKGREWFMLEELPRPLRRLTPDECEDFLCVYRDLFPGLKGGK